jgi:multidrug efflux system membrane fusion protein
MPKRGLVLSTAVALGLLSACHKPPEPSRIVTPVRVIAAESAPAAGAVRYSASLQAMTQVDVAFKVGGYVTRILQVPGPNGTSHLLQQGDKVQKGTVLASLRETDYQAQVATAKAQLASAQPGLDKAQRDYDRAKKLYPEAMTRPDYDAAVANLQAAQANAKAAQQQVAAAEIPLADTSLKAPLDAVVLARKVEVGTLVQPGTPAFTLASGGAMKAVFSVPDEVMRSLRLGQELTVVFDSSVPNPTRKGSITAMSPSADATTRVFAVEVTLPNQNSDLQLGMVASALIGADRPKTDAPVVPLSAVVRSAPGSKEYAVFVVEGQGDEAVAHLRKVVLGELLGNRVAVQSGLKPGERVIISGAQFVTDGQTVHVVA